MASFLLIHGAWHGGWAWERLVPLLTARGHIVAAPTLPGIGGSDRALAGTTLAGWAEFVFDLAKAMPGPVYLVGHSRAGVVVSAAAERAPEAFAALVYLAAFLVPPGQSMFSARDALPIDTTFDEGLSEAARGAALAISPAAARHAFYGGCSDADADWAVARLVPEPIVPMATPLALSDARYGAVPRWYIECTQDRAIPIAQQRAMVAAQACAGVVTLESDHSPFLSVPRELAAALIGITERMTA